VGHHFSSFRRHASIRVRPVILDSPRERGILSDDVRML